MSGVSALATPGVLRRSRASTLRVKSSRFATSIRAVMPM